MKRYVSFLTVLAVSAFLLTACGPSTDKQMSQAEARQKITQTFEKPAADSIPAAKLTRVAWVKNVIVPATSGFDAKTAFAEKSNSAIAQFYHWSDFESTVYPKLNPVPAMPKQSVSAYRITETSSLADIIEQTGAKPMSLNEFSQTLAYLVSKQPTGQAGELLSDGYWNIFFVEVSPGYSVAVSAYWNSDYSSWFLLGYSLSHGWYAGRQVFLRNGSGT